MKKIFFSPDANLTTGSTPPPKKKVATPNIPTKDADFDTLAQAVNKKWKENPFIVLLWITQPNFETMVNSYTSNLGARTAVGSGKSAQTETLKQVNAQADVAVGEVKIYIQKKFKKLATAQYARYGIVKEANSYILPRDNDKRKLALPLMIAAIAADGFGSEEFGTAFWTATNTSFIAALKATGDTTKGISSKVAAKDTDREKIHKVLNAITHLIYGNYPDTSDQVLREWGFIKQNY